MEISTIVSNPIITAVKGVVETTPAAHFSLKLLFYEDSTILADVSLNTLPNTILDIIDDQTGQFLGPGGLTILAGTVSTAGTVNTFKLLRQHDSDITQDVNLLIGTVGTLTSDADIKFSQTTWELYGSIIINNLTLSIPYES